MTTSKHCAAALCLGASLVFLVTWLMGWLAVIAFALGAGGGALVAVASQEKVRPTPIAIATRRLACRARLGAMARVL